MKSSLLKALLLSIAALSGGAATVLAAHSLGHAPHRTLSPLLQDDSVNGRDETGLTALMKAAQDGEDKELKSLIESGANLNDVDRYGWTALNYALAAQDSSKVRLLVNSGADVNTKDRRGITPLMWAALSGRTEMVKLLLSKGAELNAESRNGATALSFAAAKGHDGAAKFLKKAGATGKEIGKDDVPDGLMPVDKGPKILNPRDGIPGYPEEARRSGIQGVVRMRVLFGLDGSVKKIKVIRGLSHGLTEEAVRSTFRLKANPAINDGQPIEYWIPAQLSFNIK